MPLFKISTTLLSALLITGVLYAQDLPDAPSVTCTHANGKPCSKILTELIGQYPPARNTSFSNPDLDSRKLSWHDAFFSKSAIPLWAATGVYAASVIGDERDTLIGESHGCYESGTFSGYHVSLGRMGSVDWPTWFGLSAFSFTMRKLGIPILPYAAPLTSAAKHSLGMAWWHQTGCL